MGTASGGDLEYALFSRAEMERRWSRVRDTARDLVYKPTHEPPVDAKRVVCRLVALIEIIAPTAILRQRGGQAGRRAGGQMGGRVDGRTGRWADGKTVGW